MGIVADVMTVFSRKKLFGYRTIIYTVVGTGILSFFVWAHHQFIAGIDPRMANVFTVTTVVISIPIGEMLFLYIATLYGGSIRLATPMLWALSFIAEFLIGGVTGIYLGSSGADIYFPDTYFMMMNETLGKIHFWGTVIPFNLIFIPLFFLGAAGDHRRIFDYSHFPDLARPELQALRILATTSLVVMLSFQLVFLYNFINSLIRGPKAPKNPWRSNTLEWTTDSPPPHGNWSKLPTVYRGPYEYSVPGRAQDYWPQDEPA